MKSFKPKDDVVEYFPDDRNDLFIDVKFLERCRKAMKRSGQGYEILLSGLGVTVFVFDIEACEFFEKGGNNG